MQVLVGMALLCAELIGSPGSSQAKAAAFGDYDPSFSGIGWRVIAMDRGGSLTDVAEGVVQLADGRIAIAGSSARDPVLDAANDFFVSVLHPDGGLDTSFGNAGTVIIPFGAGGSSNSYARHLAVDSAGRLVVAGDVQAADGSIHMAVARVTPAGALDTSFSLDGRATVQFIEYPDTPAQLYGLAIQDDDRIVVVGGIIFSNDPEAAVAVARLSVNGAPDDTFGVAGSAVHLVDLGAAQLSAGTDVAVLADGRMLVGGVVDVGPILRDWDFLIMRLHPDGSLDQSFGASGVRTTKFNLHSNGSDMVLDLAVDANGSITCVGRVHDQPGGNSIFGIARFTADGALDLSFGTDGRAAVDFDELVSGADEPRQVLLDADGGMYVVGQATVVPDNVDVAILRLHADGTPDSEFGNGGRRVYAFDRGSTPQGRYDQGIGALFDHEGRLVVVGGSRTDSPQTKTDILVMRLLGQHIFSDAFESADGQ